MSEDECHRLAARGADDPDGTICPVYVFGATLVMRDLGTVRVSTMSFLTGFVPLSRFRERSPGLFAAVQAVVVTLWQRGIVHCDLHEDNIMAARHRVDNALHVRLVDFGHSIVLRPEERDRLGEALRDTTDPADAFDKSVLDAVMRVQRARRLDFFHCDSAFLRAFRRKCNKAI
jgi:RIO-like serine/threonine protein kinase